MNMGSIPVCHTKNLDLTLLTEFGIIIAETKKLITKLK